MTVCQQWREDEDGNAIQTVDVCDAEAKWVCCVPFVGARLCDDHKCRCAKPIGVTVVVPTDVSAECSVCGYDPQAAADECAKHITEDRGRIAELETLLRQAVADDGGLYDLGWRAGLAAARDEETYECIAAADALEARIAAALCDRETLRHPHDAERQTHAPHGHGHALPRGTCPARCHRGRARADAIRIGRGPRAQRAIGRAVVNPARDSREGDRTMKEGTIGRRVSIVFEETGGAGFKVYLDGQTPGINPQEPGEDLSPADFYASRMLLYVAKRLQEVGAFKNTTRRS